MRTRKIGILLTSRNNYQLLDFWLHTTDREGYEVLNIDEDSTDKNKEEGMAICAKHDVVYKDREERGMQNNAVTACNHFKSKGVDWIIWFQHDCFPLNEEFFRKTHSNGDKT